MTSSLRLAGVLAFATFTTVSIAAAPPLPINSNDAAARGVMRALDSFSDVYRPIQFFVDPMRRLSEFALATLNSATTPQALLTARGGVTVACPGGGSINAKLSRNGTHVLKLYWSNCARFAGPGQSSYTGHSDLTLPSDTLTPLALQKMRFGSAVEPFVETNTFFAETETDPTIHAENRWDVQLVGTLPMTRFLNSPFGIFTGEFDYRMTASYEQTFAYTYTDPTWAPFVQTNYASAIDYKVNGSTSHTNGNRVVHEVINGRRGSFAQAVETSYQPLHTVHAYELINLDVYRMFNAGDGITGTSTLTANGKIDYEWSPSRGTCGNGVYSFNTIVPIRQYDIFRIDGRDQGKVRINQTAVATFAMGDPPAPPEWYTPRPDERPTAITVKMGTAGNFTHTSYFPTSTLQTLMDCASP